MARNIDRRGMLRGAVAGIGAMLAPWNLTRADDPVDSAAGANRFTLRYAPHFGMFKHHIYHQQVTEGNLIPNIDRCWDQIGYLQCGDNPGRNEPGTGEINYANVFQHLVGKGFDGIVGMEHGNASPGREGEQAVIDAYRRVDPAQRS